MVQLNFDTQAVLARHQASSKPPRQSREEIMRILSYAIQGFGSLKLLSIRTGLSTSCLRAIVNERTSWPRWVTMQVLCDVLNLELTLRRR